MQKHVGWLVTCAHVVLGAPMSQVYHPQLGRFYALDAVWQLAADDIDLAVMRVRLPRDARVSNITDRHTTTPLAGSAFAAYGYPYTTEQDLENPHPLYGDGTVASSQPSLTVNCSLLTYGSSGSLLFSKHAQDEHESPGKQSHAILGVLSAALTQNGLDTGLRLGVEWSKVRELLGLHVSQRLAVVEVATLAWTEHDLF